QVPASTFADSMQLLADVIPFAARPSSSAASGPTRHCVKALNCKGSCSVSASDLRSLAMLSRAVLDDLQQSCAQRSQNRLLLVAVKKGLHEGDPHTLT